MFVSLFYEEQHETDTERVAAILECDALVTIADWLDQVERDSELTRVSLSKEDRAGHLPKLLQELARRRRVPQQLGPQAASRAAVAHGKLRRSQGYSASMIVEEFRILQVSILETLQDNLSSSDLSSPPADVERIADECDSLLKQTLISFTGKKAA